MRLTLIESQMFMEGGNTIIKGEYKHLIISLCFVLADDGTEMESIFEPSHPLKVKSKTLQFI